MIEAKGNLSENDSWLVKRGGLKFEQPLSPGSFGLTLEAEEKLNWLTNWLEYPLPPSV